MNNIFQPKRFTNLFIREFQYNSKSWLYFAVLFVGFPVLLFLLNIANIGLESSLETRYTFFVLFLTIILVFGPFILFSSINHPKKGLTGVMLPASTFEKYLMMQLTCLLLAPITVFVLYGGIDALLHLISPSLFQGTVLGQLFSSQLDFEQIAIKFLFLQIFVFFNLLFVRRKILKSFGSLIAIQSVMMIIFISILYLFEKLGMYNEYIDKEGHHNYNFHFDGELSLFDFDASYPSFIIVLQIFRIFFVIVLPIILMISSYYLLRNKKY